MAALKQLTLGNPEPWVILEIEGKLIDFLLDPGDTFSVLLSAPGQFFNPSVVLKDITGQPRRQIFFLPSGMHLGRSHFLSPFLEPESPIPVFGRDITSNCLPIMNADINPQVWETQGEVGQALTAAPIHLCLKDPIVLSDTITCGYQDMEK